MLNKINTGEAYDFKTQFGQNVSNIILRIEWISNENNLYAPIDISCVLLNGWGSCIETINYENLSNSNKSVVHKGDDLDQDSDIDYEEIKINLTNIDLYIEGFVFTVFANPGLNENGEVDKEDEIILLDNCIAKLINADNGNEICKYEIEEIDISEGTILMCAILKTEQGWSFKALGYGIESYISDDVKDDIEEMKLGRLRSKGLFNGYIETFKGMEPKYKRMQVALWILVAAGIIYSVFFFISM
jgi:tellurium resistance protein TerD